MPSKVRRLENDRFLGTLNGLMQDGAFSKAVKHLLSDGLHDTLDPRIRDRLAELHPNLPPVDALPPSMAWPWDTTPDGVRERLHQLRTVIMDFPAGSAAGPSGLRPQHLEDVLRAGSGVGAALLSALDNFLQFCVNGHLPQLAAPFLCSATLIPLRKPEGGLAVRPIAVGETLRRVVSKFIAKSASASRLVAFMQPQQCGVATPGACETIAMGLQSWVDVHKDDQNWAILQVDLRNAFNSIHRQPILEEVGEHAPELVPWVASCYAQHSHLYAQGHRLASRCGVQQGDPIGPLLFALAWQRIVRKLPSQLHMNIWYLDDGHLVGSPDCLALALDLIATDGARLGISLNTSKCKLWGPVHLHATGPSAALELLRQVPQIPWEPGNGLKVLGLPVEHPSTTSFRGDIVQAVVDQLGDACSLLAHLGDPQTQHLLLRYCLDACRLMHLIRGIDCTSLLPILEKASNHIRSCLGDALGHRDLSPTEWHQGTLPLRLGGLGIKDPIVLLPVARIAATLCFLHRGRQLLMPEDLLRPPSDWKVHLGAMHTTMGPTFEPVASWAPLDTPRDVEDNHRSQKWWSLKLHSARITTLMGSLPLRDACRLTLQRMPSTTAWMEVIPNAARGTKYTGSEYRVLLRWWLGMPLLPGLSTDCPCCGQTMDVYGDHLVSCKLNQPTQRHHAVRDALAQVLRDNGLSCRIEVAIGGKRRPADVAIEGVDARGPIAVDLLVHDPLCPSRPRSVATVKESLAHGEQAKVADEAALCHSNGYLFCPMGWHPWGGLGPQGAALFRRIGKIIAGDSQGWSRTQKLQAFRQPLSFALMQFVARQLQPALEARGNFCLPEVSAPRPPLPPVVSTVDTHEQAGWDAPDDEEYFVGPLRVQRRRTQ